MTCNVLFLAIHAVPPLVVAVISNVIGNENETATLQFRIDNAEPRVQLSGLQWFFSDDISQDDDGTEEITNLTTRTGVSSLMTSFSSDGVYFNITISNILQERRDGEPTDEGRYFLQATNPAGTSRAYIDLIVHGKYLHGIHIDAMTSYIFFLSGAPLIIVPPRNQFVIAGDISVFTCTTLAFPAHYTEWTFTDSDGNSTVIIRTSEGNNTKYNIYNNTESPSFGQLVVLEVEYSDRGQYMCTAINEIGTDSDSANLTVHGM